MPVAFISQSSFRPVRRTLALAGAVSLGFHILLIAAWSLGWMPAPAKDSVLARLLPTPSGRFEIKPQPTDRPVTAPLRHEVPMTFVEVDPALAPKEPPKETKYYSTDDSVAAQPVPAKPEDKPKIEGTQKNVVRTTDNVKPGPKPLEPSPPKETKLVEKVEKVEAKPKPKPADTIGDLALAKPEKIKQPDKVKQPDKTGDGAEPEKIARPPEHVRPRTLAMARQQNPMLAGRALEQDGGVERPGRVALDVKASPFGDYDRAFINAVQDRWYQLLEKNKFMMDRRGKVVVDFRLTQDGRITHVQSSDNNVGELLGLLCQKAIMDPSPFQRWPAEMRRMVGAAHREVRFTFYYD